MAELQRSSQTFRRSGSSGLVWDERLMSDDQKQRDQRAAGEAEDTSLESRELRHSRSAGSISVGTAQRRPSDGNQAFRTRHVPPALDPPSPKVPRCMFCGIFRKEEPSQPSKPRRYQGAVCCSTIIGDLEVGLVRVFCFCKGQEFLFRQVCMSLCYLSFSSSGYVGSHSQGLRTCLSIKYMMQILVRASIRSVYVYALVHEHDM